MGSEMCIRDRISASFDRILTPAEVAQLDELLKVSSKSRGIKRSFALLRRIAHSPHSLDSNGVSGQRSLTEDARRRIRGVIDTALGELEREIFSDVVF